MLGVLAEGTYTPETLEGKAIDLKEDASKRDRKTGTIQEGSPKPENVAEKLAEGSRLLCQHSRRRGSDRGGGR